MVMMMLMMMVTLEMMMMAMMMMIDIAGAPHGVSPLLRHKSGVPEIPYNGDDDHCD